MSSRSVRRTLVLLGDATVAALARLRSCGGHGNALVNPDARIADESAPQAGFVGCATCESASRERHRMLTLRPRRLDPRNTANLLGEEVDQ